MASASLWLLQEMRIMGCQKAQILQEGLRDWVKRGRSAGVEPNGTSAVWQWQR